MKKLIIRYTAAFFVFVCAGVCTGLYADEKEKVDGIRHAIQNGILSLYEIPFAVYVNLEMWDEIDFILSANNNNIIRRELPGIYYSRPYIVNEKIWVFENATVSGGRIYIFDPDTLELIDNIKNDIYAKYDGGIRYIYDHTVISGCSNEDVDAAVIWDTNTSEIKTIKLENAHYIWSINVHGDRLYIGSCGGVVNVWEYSTLKYAGAYGNEKNNTDGRAYEENECISQLTIFNDRIIGTGEKTLFIWDIESGNLLKTSQKSLNNSIVTFYKNFMIEFKNYSFAVRDLDSNTVIGEVKVEKPIEDLIVTSEKILAGYDGNLIILALRHNKGLLFYDFSRLKLTERMDVNGENLTVYENAIFATDDRNIYKYQVNQRNQKAYGSFLKNIDPEQIRVDEMNYNTMLNHLQDYPEIMEASGIIQRFLKLHNLNLEHSFKYGKIGETLINGDGTPKDNANIGYKEDIYGYKALYEIKNNSENYYFMTLTGAWSGEYGNPLTDAYHTKHSPYKHSFFIPPNGKFSSQFDVGQKEPVTMVIYPIHINKISKEYYEGFQRAMSRNNQDIAMIDKYLQDDLVKIFHGSLQNKKAEISAKKEPRSWFKRLFE